MAERQAVGGGGGSGEANRGGGGGGGGGGVQNFRKLNYVILVRSLSIPDIIS